MVFEGLYFNAGLFLELVKQFLLHIPDLFLAGHRGDGAGESGYVEFQPPFPVASVAVVVSGSCTVASSLLAQAVSPKRRTRLSNHATIFSFYSPFLSPFPSRVLLFQCTVFSIPLFRNCDRVFLTICGGEI
jgi:hypothetical protein